MDALKKIIAVVMSLVLGIYGLFGLTSGISDDYEEGKYKNVILMIGDGMGFNHVKATEDLRNVDLVMNDMPVLLTSDIDSFLIPATDSAAGGTALSTGMRVWINSVGVYPFDPFSADDINVPLTLGELVKADGKATGVVTTDKTSGATPSDFSAHTYARGNEEEICADQLTNGFDLIWGGATESINKENTAANGWTYVDNEDDLMALEAGSRSFGQFNFDDLKYVKNEHNTPTIEEMTEKAIEILDANDEGFFLMVEGACIDKHSHSNDMDNVVLSTEEFDKAVAAALEFAEKDGETLVVVTADHATGGIQYNEETGEYYFTHDTHDIIDVPVYVSATDAGFTAGKAVANRDIPTQIARVMGYGKDQFPATSASLK
ncbi:MAG: alkaline phosphatase [Clostridia bacterium]|nr:alkaline phosphatase [Clostridia bacterium]